MISYDEWKHDAPESSDSIGVEVKITIDVDKNRVDEFVKHVNGRVMNADFSTTERTSEDGDVYFDFVIHGTYEHSGDGHDHRFIAGELEYMLNSFAYSDVNVEIN